MGLSNYNLYLNWFEITYKAGYLNTSIFGLQLSRKEEGNYLFYGNFD